MENCRISLRKINRCSIYRIRNKDTQRRKKMSEKIIGGVITETVNDTGSGLPAKIGMWSKVKSFLFQEIKVELTPAQQQFEKDLNDFLHIELTWKDFHDFLFQEINFGRKSKKIKEIGE